MRIRTTVRAGGGSLQHNEATGLRLKTHVKAGGLRLGNHNELTGLELQTRLNSRRRLGRNPATGE